MDNTYLTFIGKGFSLFLVVAFIWSVYTIGKIVIRLVSGHWLD